MLGSFRESNSFQPLKYHPCSSEFASKKCLVSTLFVFGLVYQHSLLEGAEVRDDAGAEEALIHSFQCHTLGCETLTLTLLLPLLLYRHLACSPHLIRETIPESTIQVLELLQESVVEALEAGGAAAEDYLF